MRTLILLRGAPGCGKSTWIQKNGLKQYTLSADDIRLLCAAPVLNADGNYEISQGNDKAVWDMLFNLLKIRMTNGEFTVIDATNSRTAEINRYKALADEYRYRIYLVDFTDIPIETAKRRNAERDMLKRVPEEVIDKMYSRFETQGVPTGISVIKPDELTKVYWRPFDLSGYKKVHHIGDIHGCYTVLREYLGEMKDDEFYIFCGDYIDRGIENAEILEFLFSIYTKPNVMLLEGNHDRSLWLWANDRVAEPAEFELVTKTELDNKRVNKKETRRLVRKLAQCAYYTYGDKTVLVTHGGVSAIPYNLVELSARQMIRGCGTYSESEKIAQSFTANTTEDCWQIHGHRNIDGLPIRVKDTRTFNLEDSVEYGGCLRCVTLSENGFETFETKNTVFRDIREETNFYEGEKETVAKAIKDMRENKYIRETRLGNISSFNFTKNAFYEEEWNRQTMRARGLFINVPKAEIAARAYNKFFNVNEREETMIENMRHTLHFPLTAYVKYNGFLGLISYNKETDDLFIASKSTTESPYAGYLRSMFEKMTTEETRRKSVEFLKENDVTFVFECIDMENDPHVIDYPESRLILLDVVYNRLNFSKFDYADLRRTAEYLGFECKEKAGEFDSYADFKTWYDTVTEEDYEHDGEKIEGFVVEDAAGFMFKIKLAYYNFWKFLRSIATETVRKGYTMRASKLLTPVGNHFYAWIKDLREKTSDPRSIPESICVLRKMFFDSEQGKEFKEGEQ